MADKHDKKETPAPADKNAPAAAAPAAAPAPAAAAGGLKAWLPTIAAVVLAPAITWSVAQFVLLPKLQKTLAADDGKPPAAAPAAAAKPDKPAAPAKPGDKKAPETGPQFHFDNVVVNLAGTMGTRYLKTSFLVTGSDDNLATKFEAARPQLGDVTLAVLSSLTLADLEEPGSKNIIREKLVSAYNQALGQKLAENVYFSDFVVQ